jgi:hypothetical protein
MSSEPGRFRHSQSTEDQSASALPIDSEVALSKKVHPEQRVELECLGELEADHIIEHKREGGLLRR